MATLAKLTAVWTGLTGGGNGYSNFYFAPDAGPDITQAVVDNAISRTDTFLNLFQSRTPPAVRIQLNSTVELIDDTNGHLIGFMSGAPFQRGNGTGTGSYSAASGLVVNWYTGGVKKGRRVRGRTFFVPLSGNALDTNGTIENSTLAAIQGGATALANAAGGVANLVVWSRPAEPNFIDGISYDVITATVPDKAAILRSRRD